MTRLAPSVSGSAAGVGAFSAFPRESLRSVPLRADYQVVAGIRVPLGAVSLRSPPPGVATADVLLLGDRLEVGWVHTGRTDTSAGDDVVQLKAGRYRADEPLVGEDMCGNQAAASVDFLAELEAAIALLVPEGTSPKPASRVRFGLDFVPEAIWQASIIKLHKTYVCTPKENSNGRLWA